MTVDSEHVEVILLLDHESFCEDGPHVSVSVAHTLTVHDCRLLLKLNKLEKHIETQNPLSIISNLIWHRM